MKERTDYVPADEIPTLTESAIVSLGRLTNVSWQDLPGSVAIEALDQLEQAQRRLEAIRTGVVAAIEADGAWALDGARTLTSWLRERTGSAGGAAARWVRQSRALRDVLPGTIKALAAGEIGVDHAQILSREATRTERVRAQLTDRELGEEFLLEQARILDATRFATVVRSWAVAADPEAADRAWREDSGKEELTISATLGGYHVAGWLSEKSGQVVTEALGAHMGRRAEADDRTPAERRAAALTALAHQSLDAGLQGASARVRPHLIVTVPWPTLQALVDASQRAPDTSTASGFTSGGATVGDAGQTSPTDELVPPEAVITTGIDHTAMVGIQPATFPDGTPLAPTLLARLACESQLSRVVFGPDSTVLDVGREKRIFPTNQARAVIARDRHCQFPGCHEPPGFGEIHHSLWWAKHQGPTSIDHGILLCWHHHDLIHSREIAISRNDGAWQFADRHGWPIKATPHGDRGTAPVGG